MPAIKDSDEEHAGDEEKDAVNRAQEKVAELGKQQQKLSKSKADENKEEVKSEKAKTEQSKKIRVSCYYYSLL